MDDKIGKIILSGEGGQGIQTIAKIISKAISKSGKKVSYLPQFGPEQRGTPSVAFIQISREEIASPRFNKADLLVVLRERAIPVVDQYIQRSTNVLFDSSTVNNRLIKQSESKKFAIPATKISIDNFNNKNINLIIAGHLTKLLSLEKSLVWEIADKQLSNKFKNANEKQLAKKSFDFGYESEVEKRKFSKPEYRAKKSINIYKNSLKNAFISPELCKGCGICIEKCPVGALKFGSSVGVYGNPVPEIDLDKCIACGNCFRFCPDCAIKVKKISNK